MSCWFGNKACHQNCLVDKRYETEGNSLNAKDFFLWLKALRWKKLGPGQETRKWRRMCTSVWKCADLPDLKTVFVYFIFLYR